MKKCFDRDGKGILPFLGISALTGLLTAVVGTVFKLGAEKVIHLSGGIYGWVQGNPLRILLLVLGAAAFGLLAGFVVSLAKSCKGGGIPTSVAAVRGIAYFSWLPSILVLPFSALITFLCGLPLGTEGPCVQMGTAMGDGTLRCLGSKKLRGWRRYVMTGGASAGFSVATACPVSAIIFSVEELHKRFSPLLLSGVSVSVVTAQLTAELLSCFGLPAGKLFDLAATPTLPLTLFFAPLLVGVVCGVGSVLFTHGYHKIEGVLHRLLKKVSVKVVFPVLFACIALVGIALSDTLGTGHSLTDQLFHTPAPWYLLLLVFLIRGVFMMTSNISGVTGGVFLPTIALGAILGAFCGEGMMALGLLESGDYSLMVILGVVAFLGATSRIPLTACVFALEALGGLTNIPALVLAVTVAYLIAKLSGIEDFTDAVIEAKERSARKIPEPEAVQVPLRVQTHSFVSGKELGDILWPNDCSVVSVAYAAGHPHETIHPGDVITVAYTTYDPTATAEELILLVGEQDR